LIKSVPREPRQFTPGSTRPAEKAPTLAVRRGEDGLSPEQYGDLVQEGQLAALSSPETVRF